MAIKPLNSVAGFSVGETPSTVILANGDITTTNITTTGKSNLNAIGNIFISGGTNGQVIKTDGAGNLSFVSVDSAALNNGTSNVRVFDSANVTISSAGNANVLIITGTGINVAGTLNATGNANVGNLGTGGLITATGNVSGGNLTTGGVLSVTGNANVGNLGTSGLVIATGNVSGGNLTTGGVVAATGNVSGGNLTTSGVVAATGNVSGGNLTTSGALSVTGNANVGNIGAITAVFTGNVSSLNANLGNLAIANYIQGTLTTAAQPNITSVGTLTSLSVTGNIAGGNISTTGALSVTGNANVGNIGAVSGVLTGTLSVTGNANVGNLGTAGLVVATGNVSGGNLTTAGVVAATGNVSGGNLTTGGALSVTGNANVGNLGTATAIITTGNITTINSGLLQNGNSNIEITANGNVSIQAAGSTVELVVTSTGANVTGTFNATGNANVGNLGTGGLIVATGNVTGGNLTTAGVVAATGNVTGGNLTTAGVVSATGNITTSANLVSNNILGNGGAITITSGGTNTNINLKPNGTGNIDANSAYITNVQSPFNLSDAATKGYVDTLVSTGISVHPAVAAATVTTLATETGGTITYNNGASGVGANLVTTGTFLLIDGANVQTVGTRILVKNEANAAHNGIYTYANTTTIVRSTDTDTYGAADPDALGQNDLFFVTGGTVNFDTSFVVNTIGPITFGTTDITFAQFSAIQDYTAGTGLTLSSNLQFSITNTAVTTGSYGNGDRVASFTVNQQGQLTAASDTVITANAANLTGTTLASSIVTSSLTTVGTLGTLDVTGNANVGNLGTGGLIIATGNITGGNLTTTGTANIGTLAVTGTSNLGPVGNVTITGGTSGQYLKTDGSGVLSFGTVDTDTLANGTSNVDIPVANGNVLIAVGGTANVAVFTSTGVNVSGTLNATGNANVGNLGTSGAIAATGNVSGGNIAAATNVNIGNTTITWANVTTSAITANQTISSVSATGVTGVEFLVKAIDSAGAKYSVATVQAVTDGANVDYATYGTVQLGGYTGSLAVNIVGGFLRLQVTPASSNSTVWTTQYRLI